MRSSSTQHKRTENLFLSILENCPPFCTLSKFMEIFWGQKVLQAKSSLIGSLVLSKQPLMPPLLVIIWQCHSFDLEPKKVWKEQLLINRQVFPAKKTSESFKKAFSIQGCYKHLRLIFALFSAKLILRVPVSKL